MNKIQLFRNFTLTMIFIVARICSFAQTEEVTSSHWYNEEKTSKIDIYKATDGRYYGKIVWLKVAEENGKLRVDSKNPDNNLKNKPLLGLVILKGFKKSDDNHFEDGTIYDPKNGKTYSSKMTLEGDKLFVRGYVGLSLLGRTTQWTKAN